jgi:hypothetical protein
MPRAILLPGFDRGVVIAGDEVLIPIYAREAHAGGLGWELVAQFCRVVCCSKESNSMLNLPRTGRRTICSLPIHSRDSHRRSARFNIAPIRSIWTAVDYMGMTWMIGSVQSES